MISETILGANRPFDVRGRQGGSEEGLGELWKEW